MPQSEQPLPECTCPEFYKKIGKVADDCQRCNPINATNKVEPEQWKEDCLRALDEKPSMLFVNDEYDFIFEWIESNVISPLQSKISSLESENEDLKTAWALSQSENVKLREQVEFLTRIVNQPKNDAPF